MYSMITFVVSLIYLIFQVGDTSVILQDNLDVCNILKTKEHFVGRSFIFIQISIARGYKLDKRKKRPLCRQITSSHHAIYGWYVEPLEICQNLTDSKKGRCDYKSNYKKPISSLPDLSKVFQCILFDQINKRALSALLVYPKLGHIFKWASWCRRQCECSCKKSQGWGFQIIVQTESKVHVWEIFKF